MDNNTIGPDDKVSLAPDYYAVMKIRRRIAELLKDFYLETKFIRKRYDLTIAIDSCGSRLEDLFQKGFKIAKEREEELCQKSKQG